MTQGLIILAALLMGAIMVGLFHYSWPGGF